jgi:hypothetical protein
MGLRVVDLPARIRESTSERLAKLDSCPGPGGTSVEIEMPDPGRDKLWKLWVAVSDFSFPPPYASDITLRSTIVLQSCLEIGDSFYRTSRDVSRTYSQRSG